MPLDKNLNRVETAMMSLARIGHSRKGDAARCERAGVQLPPAAQRVLHQIGERGPARISDLAHLTQTGDAAVSRQVSLLEQRGLVSREVDPHDGRASRVSLTAEGRRVSKRLRQAQDEIFSELLDGWKRKDLETLAGLMERLIDDLRGQSR
jgi:DNA-binding MarR family transcriptional regulator